MRFNLRAALAFFVMLLIALPARAACTAGNPNGNVVETTPTSAFVDNGNGSVTHTLTGLMWKQCAEGLSGAGCATGGSTIMTWAAALATAKAANTAGFAGHNDWRLPNRKELGSLVEFCGYSPSINRTLFPNTPASRFWSASSYVPGPAYAWYVDFGYGSTDATFKTNNYYARLVRGGQSVDAFDGFGLAGGATVFEDAFSGAALDATKWRELRSGDGVVTVANDMAHFSSRTAADTCNKLAFTGDSGIAIEARFAGGSNTRDTHMEIVDAATGDWIQVGDTSYFSQGFYTYGTGAFNFPQNGYFASTSAFKEYRLALNGTSLTIARGDTLASLNESRTFTLPASVVGRTFYLKIGTGGPDYSPGDFDWIRVTASPGQLSTSCPSTGVVNPSPSLITPAAARLDVLQKFTVTGSGFSGGTTLSIADCTNDASYIPSPANTATQASFRCTPRLPGAKALSVNGTPAPGVTVNIDHPARLGNSAARGIPAAQGVSLLNGNVHLEATDLAVPGKGVSFALTRSYNSYDSPLEANHGSVSNLAPWRFNWDLQLGYVGADTNKIWVQREDGSGENFIKDTGVWYPVDQGNFNTLKGDTPVAGQTTLLTREGLQYIFQNPVVGGTGGLLIRILDHDGNGLTIGRDGSNRVGTVTDASNRVYTFSYDPSDGRLLSRVTDFSGRYVEYTWDAAVSIRLKTVRDVRGQLTTYNYTLKSSTLAQNPPSAQFLLTGIVDPRGNTARSFTYTDRVYGNWGANSVKDALNNTWSFVYCAKQSSSLKCSNGATQVDPTGAESFQTTSTPPLGAATITRFDTGGRLTEQVDANAKTSKTTPKPLAELTSKTYNLAALPVKRQSALGVTGSYGTDYAYTPDNAGNLLTQKDAENATTTRTWLTGTAQATTLLGKNLHRVATFASATGANHNFTHDDSGNVLTYTPPGLAAIALVYDTTGQVTGVTDSRGNASSREYDVHGSLTKTTEPGAPTRFVQNTYDDLGHILTTTDKRGGVTTNTWDEAGNLLSVYDALNGHTAYLYDANGNRTRMTDALGNVTNYTYDANNRLKTVGKVIGTQTLTTTTNYDALGRITSTVNANSHADSSTYDGEGNVLARANALAFTTSYVYDADNRVTKTTDPEGRVTSTTYDKVGRVKSVTTAAGITSYNYDADGRMTSSVDPRGNTTYYEYDAAGRLITLTDANSQITRATYDGNGNLLTVIDPGNHTTTYTYDTANRPLTRSDANGQQWVTTYDENGNVKTSVVPGPRTTTYTYDLLNRVTRVDYPDASFVSYTYDANGNRLSMIDSTGTTNYDYDALDRLASKTDPLGKTVSYSYDGIGNVKTLGYPGGQSVSYNYDAGERLISLTDWLGKTTTYTLNKAGQVTAALFGNNSRATMVYDSAGRQTSLINKKADGSVISSHLMTLDANGNITGSTTQLPLQPSLPNVDRAFTYDSANRLATYNGAAVTHDAAGRITGLSGASYSYNDRDQITAISGAQTASHAYNGEGQRVMRNIGGQITRFVIDANRGLPEVIAETDNAGTVQRRYVYGYGLVEQIDSAGAAKYYHYDPTGSTLALTNTAGAVSDTYAYTPYGETTVSGTTINPFRYVGKLGVIDDGNGLMYMRARFYRPEVARFMSLDQLAGSADEPQSLNRYAYVLGNPVMGVDPSGLEASMGDYAYETVGMGAGAVTGTVSGWWNRATGIGVTLNDVIHHPDQFAQDVIQTGKDAANVTSIAAPYLWSGTKKVGNIIVAGVTSGELGDAIIEDFKSIPQDAAKNFYNTAGVISEGSQLAYRGYQLTVESGIGYEVGNAGGKLVGGTIAKLAAGSLNTAATVAKVVHMDNVIHKNLSKVPQKLSSVGQKRHNNNAGKKHYVEGVDYSVTKNNKKNRNKNTVSYL